MRRERRTKEKGKQRENGTEEDDEIGGGFMEERKGKRQWGFKFNGEIEKRVKGGNRRRYLCFVFVFVFLFFCIAMGPLVARRPKRSYFSPPVTPPADLPVFRGENNKAIAKSSTLFLFLFFFFFLFVLFC